MLICESNDLFYISLMVFVPLLVIGAGNKTINKSLALDRTLKLRAQLMQIGFLHLK